MCKALKQKHGLNRTKVFKQCSRARTMSIVNKSAKDNNSTEHSADNGVEYSLHIKQFIVIPS